MEYVRPKAGDIYLADLPLENIFINELMPGADGDYVKVYLLARLYAEIGRALPDSQMAKELGISENAIAEAWDYWESLGAVRKKYLDEGGKLGFSVEFVNLKEMMYGSGEAAATPPDPEEIHPTGMFGSDAARKLMEALEKELGRTLSSSEMRTVIGWIEDLGATPEVVLKAVSYCAEKGKVNFKYIGKVVSEWVAKGFRTAATVDDYLDENDQRHVRQRRVLKALGLSRNPTEAESALMDAWFDELGFNMDKVLEACSRTTGISNPNIKYVDSTLRNWKQEAAGTGEADSEARPAVTMAVLKDYYEYLRNKAERDAAKRRSKIYREIPKVEAIDNHIKELGILLTRAMLQGSGQEETKYNEEIERLYEDRAILLTDNNYDMDYTDVKYLCDRCNDTGIGEMGENCTFCMSQRIAEAEEWQKQRRKDAKE